MQKSNTIKYSFTMDRNLYYAYKSVISENGENVKSDIINHMKRVLHYKTPNADTIAAIREVQRLKANPNRKSYDSFSELLNDLNNE